MLGIELMEEEPDAVLTEHDGPAVCAWAQSTDNNGHDLKLCRREDSSIPELQLELL